MPMNTIFEFSEQYQLKNSKPIPMDQDVKKHFMQGIPCYCVDVLRSNLRLCTGLYGLVRIAKDEAVRATTLVRTLPEAV